MRARLGPSVISLMLLSLFFLLVPLDAMPATVILVDIDSGLTSPTGDYRWLDIADQAYAESYRNTYNYDDGIGGIQPIAEFEFEPRSDALRGTLTVSNLKPNFTYQIKLAGTPGAADNEKIGFAGRWWQEEWDGAKWTNGQNLNDKGDGSSPNPNDLEYIFRKDITDPTSPTGLNYKYTGYLPFDFFTTDESGDGMFDFSTGSCFHVFFKTTQRTPDPNDGPVRDYTFDPDTSSPAYDTDYGECPISIYGEWERLPLGEVNLEAGEYTCSLILTEESFHGSGGTYAGSWAAAMGAEISFTIVPSLTIVEVSGGTCHLEWSLPGDYFLECSDTPDFSTITGTISIDKSVTEYSYDIPAGATGLCFRLRPR